MASRASAMTVHEGGAGTVVRVVRLLRALAEAPGPQSVGDLARAVDLPSSTVHRLLQLLRGERMVAVEERTRRYMPGDELARLGALVTRRSPLHELARPIMRATVAECDETCVLSRYLPERLAMMFIDQAESSQPLRFSMPLHTQLPLIWGATGKAIAAFIPPDALEAVLAAAGPSPVTGRRPPSLAELDERLAIVRERGYDLTTGEKIPDSVGIAAPFFDANGEVAGSLGITVPASRFDPTRESELAALAVRRAYELTTVLGAGHVRDYGNTV